MEIELSPALALALQSIGEVGAGGASDYAGLLPLQVLCHHVPACLGDAIILVELGQSAPKGSESHDYMLDAKMFLAADEISDYRISLYNASLAARDEGEFMVERYAQNCLGAMEPAFLTQRRPLPWETVVA